MKRAEQRVTSAEKTISELENQEQDLCRYKRTWNLRLHSLPEQPGENIRQKVSEVCKAVLPAFSSKFLELIDVHHLRKVRNNSAPSPGQKPCGIILQFMMCHFCDVLWKAARTLINQNTTCVLWKICPLKTKSSVTSFCHLSRRLGNKDATHTLLAQRCTLMVKILFHRTLTSNKLILN